MIANNFIKLSSFISVLSLKKEFEQYRINFPDSDLRYKRIGHAPFARFLELLACASLGSILRCFANHGVICIFAGLARSREVSLRASVRANDVAEPRSAEVWISLQPRVSIVAVVGVFLQQPG